MDNRKMIYLDDAIAALMQLPSEQFKRINKETHEINESDKISYAVVCDKFPDPCVF